MWELVIHYKNGKVCSENFNFETDAYKFLAEIKKKHKVKDFNITFVLQS